MRLAVLFLTIALQASSAAKVLIVADEFPAMENLSTELKQRAGLETQIVKQTDMPADLSKYPAVIVYIHRTIGEPAEKAFIQYAKSGGRLLLIHHSISSGKRPNKQWFPFLGVELPQGQVMSGGYQYYEGITMQLVNLAPNNYITTHDVKMPETIEYNGKKLPGLALEETEVYLNQVLSGPRTMLLGIRYVDEKNHKTWTQDTGGWYKKTEKGWVLYFMAGHSAKDFLNPVYAQILTNALTAKLK